MSTVFARIFSLSYKEQRDDHIILSLDEYTRLTQTLLLGKQLSN